MNDAEEAESWLADLDERDWKWWSGAAFRDLIKVDITSTSMPISDYMLRRVITRAGASVVYNDVWIPTPKLSLIAVVSKDRKP